MSEVKDFKCNGCGAPLPIPKNSKGYVKCPSCKTECVIEGLVKNAEMAAKENIASGIPLTASSAILHSKLLSYLTQSPNMPLDVFEKGEVVREEHHCVPAFYFYCNGTASYTYEAGNIRQHKTAIDLGDKTRVETQNYMEWTQMSGNANASAEMITSGNKKFGTQIRDLYMFLDNSKLYDFAELEFPYDVVTHDYNFPQTASFNEYAKPYMEELLKKNAAESLKGKDVRNLSIGGNRIDKDEVVRIFLGLYRVVFKYGDKEYSIWVTGDGKNAINEGMPEDSKQKMAIEEKKQAMEREVSSIPVPTTGKFTAGFWGSIILGIILAVVLNAHGLMPLGFILGIVGAIVFKVLKSKMMNPYNAKCAEIRATFQKEIDVLENQTKNTIQEFKAKKQALRGIYAGVSGDASAF